MPTRSSRPGHVTSTFTHSNEVLVRQVKSALLESTDFSLDASQLIVSQNVLEHTWSYIVVALTRSESLRVSTFMSGFRSGWNRANFFAAHSQVATVLP